MTKFEAIEEQLMMGANADEVARHFNVSLNYVHEIQEEMLPVFAVSKTFSEYCH